ncbi:hypothetical protein Tsubulata_001628 [Turnera subulata]|uniref:DUF632 domain-containing protein n=1 Tax=Turnera subulata TaxID=218843 RepID=A0A9Q0FU05_9ROSI|nr:hypothetical protein Tsubulata_001628 [Turnera subulata]
MGCVASRIDKEERVQICKERKRLMKQLVVLRGEFANSQLAYLRALKNTGVTLRQFTESESLELENTSYALRLPPSPPLPLPPSPPPPPPFSPDSRKSVDNQKDEVARAESIKLDEDDCDTPPASMIPSSSWNIWGDPFEFSTVEYEEKTETVEPMVEEDNWAETKTEFEEDDREGEVVPGNAGGDMKPQKQQVTQKQPAVELVDDIASTMSWSTKDTGDMAVAVRRGKKTLESIVKELDDYFLKASAGGKEIAVLMNLPKGDISLQQNFKENKRKRSNSAKVFSALSWSWSSKSLQFAKDAVEACNASEACKLGAHCFTLDKLYVAEQKLYKEVKEEALTKLELEKKTMLLLKQEEEDIDWTKTEKTRSSVEALEVDIRRLQHSIGGTCSSVLELIDAELHPQLVTLTCGLKNMWRTMCECHQVQNHIAQQLNHLTDSETIDLATDYHRQATAQLETEVASWHVSFCKLIQAQQEYVRTLCKWIHLTDSLVDDQQHSSCSAAVCKLCEEWHLVFDRLPDKIASEAIKSLLSAIQSITLQQVEEYNLQRKSDKLEKRLQKELLSLAEMEKKLDLSFAAGDECSNLSPKHPVSIKRAKTEALKRRVDTEKTKYQNSVQVTRVMTLNNLKTSLPSVFQALMEFSSAYAKALEAVHSHGSAAVEFDASETMS